MEFWLRIALLVVSVGGGFALYVALEAPVKRTMIRAARGNVWRALTIVFAYYAINLVAAYVIWTIAQAFYVRGHATTMALVLSVGMLALTPFALMYWRRPFGLRGNLSVTERGDMQERGAELGVARAIAWPGVFLALAMMISLCIYGVYILTA